MTNGPVGGPRPDVTLAREGPVATDRACYVVVDGATITWRRLEYEFEKTAAKIDQIAQLDAALAARLKEGI